MKNSRKRKLIFLILITILVVIPFMSIGYSALATTLNIRGDVLSMHVSNRTVEFPEEIEDILDTESCMVKYNGNVTDQVGVTTDAHNVYYNKCTAKRNIIFGGFCWQMIRTTETGGMKLLYNGEPNQNGQCPTSRANHSGVVLDNYSNQSYNSNYLYGLSFTYDTSTSEFKLKNTFLATWTDSTYENLVGKFTCKSTGDTCTTLYQLNDYRSNTQAYSAAYKVATTNFVLIGMGLNNASFRSPAMVGYMFNKVYYYNTKYPSTTEYKYGNSFTYDSNTRTYTLSGITQNISDWSTGFNTLQNTHYTCWNTTGTCNTISYVYNTTSSYASYFDLTGGKNINDAFNEMLFDDNVNKYNSSIKGVVDAWYDQYLSSRNYFIEDAVYCNSRDIVNYGGFNPDGGYTNTLSFNLHFKNHNHTKNLSCLNETDQFAVSNNKAKLTYPIGLLQEEERYGLNSGSLITTGAEWWEISPESYDNIAMNRYVKTNGDWGNNFMLGKSYGFRPVISLKNSIEFSGGTGSETDPWVVDELSFDTMIDTYDNKLKNAYLSDTYRDKIKTVTISNSISAPSNPVASFDIGVNNNGKVMAYLVTNSQDNTMYDLYIQGDGNLKANYDSSKLFYSMTNLETINNLSLVDMSDVESLAYTFAGDAKLSTIDLSNFNSTKLRSLEMTFAGSTINGTQVNMAINNVIGLNNIDTSKVTSMRGLFLNNVNWTTINISNWDSSNVIDFSSMFNNSNDLSSKLTTITFGSGFNTSSATSYESMFADNTKLVNLDVSGFNTSNVTNMSYMFSNTLSLTSLNLSNFNTSNVTDMSWMFCNWNSNTSLIGDSKLASLNVSSFNTSKVTKMDRMFMGLNSLTSLNLTNFDTSNVTDMTSMFGRSYNLSSLVLGNWNTTKVTSMSHMFYRLDSLPSLDISSFQTPVLTNIKNMFAGCYILKNLNISNMDFSNVTGDYYRAFNSMPTKAQGVVLHVKDTAAQSFILGITNDPTGGAPVNPRPPDWDTTNVIIG